MAHRHLLQPLTMRALTARNRLWLPPMCMYSVDAEDGIATDWHVVHYGSRAQGGFGTIIVEASAVTPEGRLSPNDLGLWDDAQIAGHRRIVEAIHAGGALAGVQLGHGGRKAGTPPWRPDVDAARSTTLPGWDLVAPSAIAYPDHAVPRALDADAVAHTVQAFAAAARRAVEAGYDVVELHGAHGYLIHQFLSPLSNTRTDAYGGTDAGRRRFALEAVAA
ncbi:NADH:flavin oxidoreductase/NADH oxidase, partial [Actinomyces sp. MRS3W]|nr:NADH:flavin oxidoreductase/NADH oxidase [Actinomyces sp. MRS3W]